MRPHTPGPWRIGKGYDSVVSDTPPNPRLSSSLDADEVAAYGGYIIAESITKNNKALIAKAPELLDACLDAYQVMSVCRFLRSRPLLDHILVETMSRLDIVSEAVDELAREQVRELDCEVTE